MSRHCIFILLVIASLPLMVFLPEQSSGCGNMGSDLLIGGTTSFFGDDPVFVLDLTAVVPTSEPEGANCTAGIGLDDQLNLLGTQVLGVSLAITDLTTHEIVESLIPSRTIPPFERNSNTTIGLAEHDPLGLPHWSGFVAIGVTELRPRELERNEAYSLVFDLEFPDRQAADEFGSILEEALRKGLDESFPLNIATGSGDRDGNPFFGPPHGNNFAVQLEVAGDTNDDRLVNIIDLNAVRNNFGATGPDDGTLPGDAFPFDGMVNVTDLNAVRNNFGAGATPVPEPSTLALASLFVFVAVIARRRRS